MATSSRLGSRRLYSWWWDSHIGPKNSKWLQDNLTDMDIKVKAMIKIIEEDADSFARRAEMYYKKRPELMKLVEEFYRAYRALAERYDHATGVLRQAHRTITEAFPNQIPLALTEESPSSSGNEVEPHTPEMPPPICALLDLDDLQLHSMKRNGAYSDSSDTSYANLSELRARKGLNFEGEEAGDFVHDLHSSKDIEKEDRERGGMRNEIVALQQEVSCLSTENQSLRDEILFVSERAILAESEVQRLTELISHLSSEKDDALFQHQLSVEKLLCLSTENQSLRDQILSVHERADLAESEVQRLKDTTSHLSFERDDALLQHQQSVEKLSCLSTDNQSLRDQISSVSERADLAESEVQRLKDMISDLNSDKDKVCLQHQLSVDKLSCLLTENQSLRDQILFVSKRADLAESELQRLKDTISHLISEKDEALLQHQLSVERLSSVEDQLSKSQNDSEKLRSDMAKGIEKLDSAQKLNHSLQSEVEQSQRDLENLRVRLQEECQHREQAKMDFLSMENLYSRSQEEVKRSAVEIQNLSQKLNEAEQSIVNLQTMVCMLKNEINSLNDQKLDLNDKTNLLLEIKENLENEIQSMKQTISQLNSEKDETLHEHQLALERLANAQNDIRNLTDDMAKEAAKLKAIEKLNHDMLLEMQMLEKKIKLQELELEQKTDEMNSARTTLFDEQQKYMEAEAALRSMENMVSKLKKEIDSLYEEKASTDLQMRHLHDEIRSLKDLKEKLENVLGLHLGEKEALLQDLYRHKEDKNDLEQKHQSLKEQMDRISEKNAVLENSLSDANAELEASREKITVLEASTGSLHTEISTHVSEKAVLLSLIEALSQNVAEISEKNSALESTLTDMNAELELLRGKLRDSSETNLSLLSRNSVLVAEKDSVLTEVERTTSILKNLENRHADLEDEHSILLREKDLTSNHVKDLQDLLNIKTQEHESTTMILKSLENKHADLEDRHSSLSREKAMIHSQVEELRDLLDSKNQEHESVVQSHEKQLVTLQNQINFQQERLEEEQFENMSTSICILVLERSLSDMKDKNLAVSIECQKHCEASLDAENMISRLKQNAQDQERKQKALWVHNGKLREGIHEIMEALKICQNLESVNGIGDEVLLEAVKCEISNILEEKEGSEDLNQCMHIEMSILATILKEIVTGMEQEIETKIKELLSLENKNHELVEMNRKLKQELQASNQSEEVLKFEMEDLRQMLLDSEDELCNLSEKNHSMSKGLQSLLKKYNGLEEDNSAVLAEAMLLEHLYTFFRSLSEERALQLKSIADEMASLCLVKSKVDDQVRLLSRKVGALEVENSHLTRCLAYVEELGARLVILEFDLYTTKDISADLTVQLLESNKKVEALLEKNTESSKLIEALQMDIEGVTVLKSNLEMKICTLSKENYRLLKEVEAREEMEEQLTCELQDSAAIFEEKVVELMMENESNEISVMIQRDVLCDSISSREASIDDLKKKLVEMEGENMKLMSGLNSYLDLVTLLQDSVDSLEAHALSLSKHYKCKGTKENTLLSDYCESSKLGGDDHAPLASGAFKLQSLIAKVDAVQNLVIDIGDSSKQERSAAATELEAVNKGIGVLNAKASLSKEANKPGQMMKDIELDQISTPSPYDNGASLYPLTGNKAAVLDDQMLQLWETAERDCVDPVGKPSSAAVEHDIEVVEEVKSEHPSSELTVGKEVGFEKLEETLASDAKRLSELQTGIDELKRKMESTLKRKSPPNVEYNTIRAQLNETEKAVLEQIDINESTTRAIEQERFAGRREMHQEAQKESEKIGQLELEIQKIHYILLKLGEEHGYRRTAVADKSARVLLRDYLYGRKDKHGQKKRGPFCGCMRPKTKGEN